MIHILPYLIGPRKLKSVSKFQILRTSRILFKAIESPSIPFCILFVAISSFELLLAFTSAYALVHMSVCALVFVPACVLFYQKLHRDMF